MNKITNIMIVLLTLLLVVQQGQTQQLEYYALSSHNWQLINPAAINYLKTIDKSAATFIDASYRKQWLGFEEAPTSFNVRFETVPTNQSFAYTEDSPIKYGFYASRDKTDAISTTNIYGNFAYIIRLNRKDYFSVGLNAGVFQYKLEADKINFKDPLDPSAINQNEWHADFALGVYFMAKERFYLGLSVPQIFNFKLNDRDPATGFFQTERTPHVYFIGGGFIPVSIGNGKNNFIEPTILLRYVSQIRNTGLLNNFPFSTDFKVKLHYDSLWGGIGFGTSKNLLLELGTILGDSPYGRRNDYIFKIGAVYTYPLGFNGLQFGQTAEIVLGLGF